MITNMVYLFYPGRSLVFFVERPVMPSAAFLEVVGSADGDIKFSYGSDGSSWAAGATHSVLAKSLQRVDLPTGGQYIRVQTEVELRLTVAHSSDVNFVELGHEAL